MTGVDIILLIALVGMLVWGAFVAIREITDPSEEVEIEE